MITAYSHLRSPWRFALAVALFIASSTLLHAGTIIVTSNEWPDPTPVVNNGLCSLPEAIWNVNARGRPYVDCATGANPSSTGIDILINGGIGDIEGDFVLTLERSARIIGPSADNKAVIKGDASSTGLLVIKPYAFDYEEFELTHLRFENSRKIAGLTGEDSPCYGRRGGAVCADFGNSAGRLRISSSEFFNNSLPMNANTSFRYGGAVAAFGDLQQTHDNLPTVIIRDSSFISNSSEFGGAVHLEQVNARVSNNRFLSNETREAGLLPNDSTQGAGGAMAIATDGTVNLSSLTFIGNLATYKRGAQGAALFVSSPTITLYQSRFHQNGAFDIDFNPDRPNRGSVLAFRGRGIQSSFSIFETEISNNSAAGVDIRDTSGEILGMTLNRNRFATSDPTALTGAAGSFDNVIATIKNSTIVENFGLGDQFDAIGMGGLDVRNSNVSFEHVTIAENRANGPPSVGGLRINNGTVVSLQSTLLAENFGSLNGNVQVLGTSILNSRGSQFGDDASEINGIDSLNTFNDSAGLDPVQDMGCLQAIGERSDQQCIQIAPLTATAIARDRADPATMLLTDQRGLGFSRKVGPASIPDIGAHEYQLPIINIEPGTITHRNEGTNITSLFPFIVRRIGDKRQSSSFDWSISGEGPTPADQADFLGSWAGGNEVFAVGEDSRTVWISVNGDNIAEANESFRFEVGGLVNARPGDLSAEIATILNDDALIPAATISLAPSAVNLIEGDFIIGSEQTFRVTRSQVLGGICSFQAELSAIGPAGVSSEDFINWSLGTQTFVMQPGEEFVDISLQVRGDGLYEGDEAFRLRLINPSGCFIDSTAASVDALIVDDESLINITSLSTSQPEGTGGLTEFFFQVSRAGYRNDTDSVSWSVSGSSAHPASANDFAADVLPAGTVGFPPGIDAVTFSVLVEGDAVEEMDEGFTVELAAAIGGEVTTGAASAIIVNDDTTSDRIFSDRFQ
jgi:hypothetical protein